ncbi:hypothetical protein TIFTF001_028255 [Ficus carica]|uniref:Uncharacterized protein n=1 Tax=Ficus carica TaxID=3494 RepID=A0AA88DPK5_FICCA|nr:hypothetical protein TIFTF001_028255 [Ficus carica]
MHGAWKTRNRRRRLARRGEDGWRSRVPTTRSRQNLTRDFTVARQRLQFSVERGCEFNDRGGVGAPGGGGGWGGRTKSKGERGGGHQRLGGRKGPKTQIANWGRGTEAGGGQTVAGGSRRGTSKPKKGVWGTTQSGFPFWHYLRLIIVCLLVIPSFDGAFYVYKQVTSSLLSMDAQIIINWFNKPKEASAETQKILAKVEKYVRENGAEALEEIIADKSGSSKDPDVKEIKAFPSIDNEVVNQPNSNGPYVARKGIKAVEEIEKNEVKAAMLSGSTKDPDVKEIEAAPSIDNEVVNQPNSNKPYVARKGIKAVEEIEKNEVKAAMLSGSTKDPDVKEIKAAPSVDNEVVNQATSNGLNVARKDIQAVEEIEKNEVKAAMQRMGT